MVLRVAYRFLNSCSISLKLLEMGSVKSWILNKDYLESSMKRIKTIIKKRIFYKCEGRYNRIL